MNTQDRQRQKGKQIQFDEPELDETRPRLRRRHSHPLRLQLHIQGASGLPLLGRRRNQAPNVYVKVLLDDKLFFRTQTIKGSRDPTWHENSPSMEMSEHAVIHLCLMHRTQWLGSDICLARSSHSVADIMQRQQICDKEHVFETSLESQVDGFSPKISIGLRELASEKHVPDLISEAKARAEAYRISLISLTPSLQDPSSMSDSDSSPSTSSSGLSEVSIESVPQ
ncbi:hypothetical protein EYR40_007213 [Pleurotus pulmonarius]|nr:hypothetical protein EYR36_003507 [Pleurotus pulmonarius]KAF4600107.1 hypothetical protein EYR40_007213 [Pleurotus pulmonarius]